MKKFFKRLSVLLALALLTAGVVIFLYLRSGSGQLETWLGKQLVGIVSTYVHPKIDFRKVKYHYPGEVVLTDVSFTAQDGTRVVACESVKVTLSEIPSIGSVLKIERIELINPAIQLIAAPGGGFKGLIPFVKAVPGKESAQTPAEFKLSSVLQLRKFILNNGSIVYEPGGGQPVMKLDGISADMDIKPVTVGGEQGWYELAFKAGRAPGVEVDAKGQLNVDSSVANIASATMNVTLDDKTIQGLPPQLQTTLKSAEAKGKLAAHISGRIPLQEWQTSDLAGQITISDFNVAAGRFKLPIDHGTIPITLKGGIANLDPIQFNLLAGQLSAAINANLASPSIPVQGKWQTNNLDLAKLMRAQQDVNAPPGFQGQAASSGNFAINAGAGLPAAILATTSGSANLTVRDGRLFVVPGLVDAMKLAGNAAPAFDDASKHSLDADFILTGSGLQVTQSHIVASALDARATGLIGWDLGLNLEATADPIASVTKPLGQIGKLIGTVTKQMIQYHIGGTVGDPKVTVKPFGIGGS